MVGGVSNKTNFDPADDELESEGAEPKPVRMVTKAGIKHGLTFSKDKEKFVEDE